MGDNVQAAGPGRKRRIVEEQLPKSSDWVCIERPVTTNNRNLLHHCLGNEHAVEWVTMMKWQNRNCRCMVHTHVEKIEMITSDLSMHESPIRFSQIELPNAHLNGDFPNTSLC
jgi:hypothetical protein